MKRIKKHKVKSERPKTSSSGIKEQEEHDLAYYIHDRVELMHQVFSVLKYKELKAIAPECVRNISVGDLQELCTEELLGISSKRLCAILDGGEPPSDTESSSRSPSPELETISLDSISSDEEILSQDRSKKNKKHKHKRCETKQKQKKKSKDHPTEDTEASTASRAGLTVLELLELQARARAIRAQLQQEQVAKRASESAVAESTNSRHSSDNEVMIKEEPPEVVEISSDDETTGVQQSGKVDNPPSTSTIGNIESAAPTSEETVTDKGLQTVTKHINDLIITVPQTKPSKKIKLNRNNKVTVSEPNITKNIETSVDSIAKTFVANEKNAIDNTKEKEQPVAISKLKEKSKKKAKRQKKNIIEKEGSDHDEITLQLSDSEKMDLLEDLDRKTFENVSSSVDSESSSSDSENSSKDTSQKIQGDHELNKISQNEDTVEPNVDKSCDNTKLNQNMKENDSKTTEVFTEEVALLCRNNEECQNKPEDINTVGVDEECLTSKGKDNSEVINLEIITEKEIASTDGTSTVTDDPHNTIETSHETTKDSNMPKETIENDNSDKNGEQCIVNKNIENETEFNKEIASERELSEGEVSDRESSEVEAVDLKPEVLCISDEEASKSQKKKKKKDKKSKKEKKSKKPKSDFPEGANQNFYKNSIDTETSEIQCDKVCNVITIDSKDLDNDNAYEIFELSDDSSCYEVEGTVLSKEPTAEEIEALSAKIDEIERKEVITQEQISEYERLQAEKEGNNENIESVSWKDRYLGSTKVKKVLITSNIFNALRNKNKELKKKLKESKEKEEIIAEKTPEEIPKDNLEEGSIEHYNTLQGSTRYVDPVLEATDEDKHKHDGEAEKNDKELNTEPNVTKEMKKDAKLLLKMYRRLLKYNDMDTRKDPHKKKKKKAKKKKEKCPNDSIAGNAISGI